MVKRKAETNLDEWLERGVLYAEANRARATAATVEEASEPSPAAVGVPLSEEAASLPTTLADMAERDDADWFWDLLAQSGYERWWLA